VPAGGCLPAGLPIACLIGDSHGALYGHAGFEPGSVKATYGTGSSLMTPTDRPVISQHGLSATIAWAREEATPRLAVSPSPCPQIPIAWAREQVTYSWFVHF
jgi:glycerol kinase